MSTLSIVLASVLGLALLVGAAVVLLGAVIGGWAVVRQREAESVAALEPIPPSQAQPVPLTRLVSARDGLRPASGSSAPASPPGPPPGAPTPSPEPDDGAEPFGDLVALFDRLDRGAEEDSTELLSKEERLRLYGGERGVDDAPSQEEFHLLGED